MKYESYLQIAVGFLAVGLVFFKQIREFMLGINLFKSEKAEIVKNEKVNEAEGINAGLDSKAKAYELINTLEGLLANQSEMANNMRTIIQDLNAQLLDEKILNDQLISNQKSAIKDAIRYCNTACSEGVKCVEMLKNIIKKYKMNFNESTD